MKSRGVQKLIPPKIGCIRIGLEEIVEHRIDRTSPVFIDDIIHIGIIVNYVIEVQLRIFERVLQILLHLACDVVVPVALAVLEQLCPVVGIEADQQALNEGDVLLIIHGGRIEAQAAVLGDFLADVA